MVSSNNNKESHPMHSGTPVPSKQETVSYVRQKHLKRG